MGKAIGYLLWETLIDGLVIKACPARRLGSQIWEIGKVTGNGITLRKTS
jgi:hypothetical protein